VRSSGASTAETTSYELSDGKFVAGVVRRRYVKTTSRAVSGTPSDHTRCGRSLYVSVRPSAETPPFARVGTACARSGATRARSSITVRPLKSASATKLSMYWPPRIGSSVAGCRIDPTRIARAGVAT